MTKISEFFKRIPALYWLALASGILTGTSYIPFKGWALLFCYIPLWIGVLNTPNSPRQLRQVFWAGWVTQFILTLIGFNWIFYVSSEFGHLHWSLSAGALLLFAALMHLYIPVALVLGVWVFRRFRIHAKPVQFFILALFMAMTERIWPSIFEWNLAYTLLWIKLPLFQWADTVGFWGLSTWLLLFQAAFAWAYTEFKSDKLKTITIALSALIVLLVLNWIGGIKGKSWTRSDQVVKIAIAQGNIGNAEKVQSEKQKFYHSYIRDVYTDLSSQHLKSSPADLIIWPETALPFAMDEHFWQRTEQRQMLETIRLWQTPVITGAYSVSPTKRDHLGYSLTRNAVFYLSPQMGFLDKPYFKTNLLVFGEYMPFGEEFPILYRLLPFVGVYEKGSGPITAKLQIKNNLIVMGPQICYDSLVPGFSRGLAENGAQIIFNVTNDSWFGWWAEPYQHGIMTLARAIEVRRPLVRSTNTGISSAILADGTQLLNSPINESWAHTYDISYRQNPVLSFYTLWGHYDWVLWLLVLAGLILFYKQKGEHVRS